MKTAPKLDLIVVVLIVVVVVVAHIHRHIVHTLAHNLIKYLAPIATMPRPRGRPLTATQQSVDHRVIDGDASGCQRRFVGACECLKGRSRAGLYPLCRRRRLLKERRPPSKHVLLCNASVLPFPFVYNPRLQPFCSTPPPLPLSLFAFTTALVVAALFLVPSPRTIVIVVVERLFRYSTCQSQLPPATASLPTR